MNNFVFSQDPLLFNTLNSRQSQQSDYEMKRQLDEALAQYQALAQNQTANKQVQNKDYLGEIDNLIKSLDENVITTLASDSEYMKINEDLQKMVQEEMMRSVKWRINSNQDAINKMERLKEIISSAKKTQDDEDRKIMTDINDYIKNYSDLTFDEYKKLKSKKQ